MKLLPNFHINKAVWAGLFGTSLFCSGVLLLSLWSVLFDFIVSSMLVLKPNSQMLDLWRKAPMPLALDFYFFNWTNPEDIYNPEKKPAFTQIGPYRFIENREKVNLTWNWNHTISYRLFRSWYFDEQNSAGKLSDQVTTLNAVTLSAANQVKNWSYFMKRGFSMSLAAIAPRVEITKSIGQLLFDGYEDPYIDMALNLPFLADTLPPFDKFGWFYKRNESYTFDGIFNMNTGVHGNIGELLEWNYENETKYYKGSCAKVHGSGAELYPRNHSRDHVGFFSPDMCRHVQLDYEADVFVKNVAGYKYSAQSGMFDNGTILPENECYCNGDCVPSGMVNISSCRYGTPAFVSLPHFYGADPMYLSMVEGLAPEKSKHELYLTLEPTIALPLDGAIRLQLNMLMSPIKHITLYENVPRVFFPLLWFEQRATMPDHLVSLLKLLLNAPTIFSVLAYILIIAGISLVVYAICKTTMATPFCYKPVTYHSREEVPLRNSAEDPYISPKRKSILSSLYRR